MRFLLPTARKKWLARTLLSCLLTTVACAGAESMGASETAALGWLAEMRHAVAERNYKGVVAYMKDGQQMESFQLFHAAKSGVEQERLVSMNSPLREVIRSAEKVSCYFPDTKKVFIENKPGNRSSSALVDLPEDLSQLSRYYRVNLQGQEYVARRLSQVVAIEPRDDYRYARLVWVDAESKLPLKFEMLDEDGQTVEQMVFTSVSLEESIPQKDLEPSVAADSFSRQTGQTETLPLDSLHWTIQNVPEGFHIVSYTRMKRSPASRDVDHVLLSDGFSSVSIYLETQKGGFTTQYSKRLGTLNAKSLRIDDYSVTVMGEVPAKTVEAIAHGLKHQGGPQP